MSRWIELSRTDLSPEERQLAVVARIYFQTHAPDERQHGAIPKLARAHFPHVTTPRIHKIVEAQKTAANHENNTR